MYPITNYSSWPYHQDPVCFVVLSVIYATTSNALCPDYCVLQRQSRPALSTEWSTMMGTCSGWTPVASAAVREGYPCALRPSVESSTVSATTFLMESVVRSVKVR